MNAVILLDKPAGITSHTSVQVLKRCLSVKKIGHAGTLDKFATGLLIVLVNSATKLSNIFLSMSKCYEAEIVFGVQTDTLDSYGIITATTDNMPNEFTLRQGLSQYHGTIAQIPPQYSAVHVNGVRAYQRARMGEAVDILPRAITVFNHMLVQYQAPKAVIRWCVSSGTYIRALARDVANHCNTVAYVSNLRRISINNFDVEHANTIEMFKEYANAKNVVNIKGLYTIDSIVSNLGNTTKITVHDKNIRAKLVHGVQPQEVLDMEPKMLPNAIITLYDDRGMLGVWQKREQLNCVLNNA